MLALLSPILFAAVMKQSAQPPVFPPAIQAIADRPNVFQSRTYVPTPLPTFQQAKPLLPAPVLQLHPEWVRLYWKAWELAFSHLKQPSPASGFVSNFMDPAFNANTFQWDTCFMAQFGRYGEPAFHAIGSLDNFYAKQHADGYICREIVRATGEDFIAGSVDDTINPPLFSWTEWEYYVFTGDKNRLADVLPRLVKYYGWLKQHRRRPNDLYWNTGLGSGEDDLTRKDSAYSWVDMSSQMVQNALCISEIATALGEQDAAAFFRAEAQDLAKLIDSSMWDPNSKFYYDLKEDGSVTGIKTILGFWPLLAHMVPKDRLPDLVGHLRSPNEFDRPNPVPALSADELGYSLDGQYWNGAVWAPTEYMLAKGLEDYGFEDDAERISAKYLANMSRVFEDTGTIWENYAPEYAAGHGVKDMVGWSGLGPIALLIENIIGIRVSAIQNRIVWRIRMSGQVGAKNLMLGSTHVSMVAGTEEIGRRVISISCDAPFTLDVNVDDGKPLEFHVKAGESKIGIPAPYTFSMAYGTRTLDTATANLSIHQSVESSSDRSTLDSAKNIVAANPGGGWSSQDGAPQYVKVDLGDVRTILGIDLLWGAAYAKVFSVEVSKDGKAWTPMYHTTEGRGQQSALSFQGRAYSGRYVRVNCLSTDGNDAFFTIQALRVWGH